MDNTEEVRFNLQDFPGISPQPSTQPSQPSEELNHSQEPRAPAESGLPEVSAPEKLTSHWDEAAISELHTPEVLTSQQDLTTSTDTVNPTEDVLPELATPKAEEFSITQDIPEKSGHTPADSGTEVSAQPKICSFFQAPLKK